jgi:hypothetical protein
VVGHCPQSQNFCIPPVALGQKSNVKKEGCKDSSGQTKAAKALQVKERYKEIFITELKKEGMVMGRGIFELRIS